MHRLFTFVFYITLALYLITLLTVSYVGVYLTYIALPLIVVSGLLMRLTRRKPQAPGPVSTAVATALSDAHEGIGRVNDSLQWFNEKNRLVRERCAPLNTRIQTLRRAMIEPEVKVKYEQDAQRKRAMMDEITRLEQDIAALEAQKEVIRESVEIEIARRRAAE